MVVSFTFEGKPVVVIALNVAYVDEQLSQHRGESRIHFVGGGEKAVDQTVDEVRRLLASALDEPGEAIGRMEKPSDD